MGGWGSGRGIRWRRTRQKNFVEQYRYIDARFFPYSSMQYAPNNGLKTAIYGIELSVFKDRLEVQPNKDNAQLSLSIPFSYSQGNYGNLRYWLTCPIPTCYRRCRKLFLIQGSSGISLFLCKDCLHLAHKSQNRTKLDRIIAKKWGLIRKLKCDSDIILDSQKPKWMHWKTFNRIRAEIEILDREASLRIGSMCS